MTLKPKFLLFGMVQFFIFGLLGFAAKNFFFQSSSFERDQGHLVSAEGQQNLLATTIERVSDRIRKGESLSSALARHQISSKEIFYLSQALRSELNLRTIQTGDVIVFERRASASFSKPFLEAEKADKTTPSLPIEAFELVRMDESGVPLRYRVSRKNSTLGDFVYAAIQIHTPVMKRAVTLSGRISNNLYESILWAGGDASLVNRFSDVFAWKLDFYREAQKGDVFKMVVESKYVEGRFVGYGRVLAAEYNKRGKVYRGFFYESEDGRIKGIFDEQGNSLEKGFLRSPLELARITSRYGQRFHPVLKRQKKHNGIDYGARHGTPFWSVADGVVLEARYSLTAGKMIRIQHRGGYITEYFHASGFAKGIRPGAFVKQKQVVGYVGDTGRCTGAHLHFGMLWNKRYVDPSRQKILANQAMPRPAVKNYLKKVKPLLSQLESVSI